MSYDVEIVDNSQQFLREFDNMQDKMLEMIGLQAAGYAQLYLESSPRRVDTGLLRNSIAYAIAGKKPEIVKDGNKGGQKYHSNDKDKNGNEIEVKDGKYDTSMPKLGNEKSVYIGTNVEYAPYVHEGTQKMEANRYIRKAVENHKDEYKQMIIKTMKGEL